MGIVAVVVVVMVLYSGGGGSGGGAATTTALCRTFRESKLADHRGDFIARGSERRVPIVLAK